LATAVGDLDLIGEVPGLGVYEAVKIQAEEVELYGFHVRVLTLEGLISSKQAAGRPKDLRLLPELQALQALRGESPKDKK
jgi:predicted nucleotidyltransferase